jgi:UDP-glucose 4-epimerase
MKIMVTGGAGFIASHVVDAYVALGHDVVVVDDLSSGRVENLNPGARFYRMCITDPELDQLYASEKPQMVNHHAAQVNVRKSLSDPLHDASVNVLGSVNVLECAVRHRVARVIYSSSGGAVYGEPEQVRCTESHPIRPLSPYGVSKYAVELYLHSYATMHGIKWIALRYGNVYGPRQDPRGEAGVVALFLAGMIAGKRPVVFGDGEQSRDFVYVADCVMANVKALDPQVQGAFNIGSGVATSVNELYRLLSQLTGFTSEPTYESPKEGETRHIALDITKAAQRLDWRPQYSLMDGLSRTAAHFLSEPAPN